MFEPRKYREKINRKRFRGREIVIEESDLWIGVDSDSFLGINFSEIEEHLGNLRSEFKNYLKVHPTFLYSHTPIKSLPEDPPFILELKACSLVSNTGPMAGIAGYFAKEVALFIEKNFFCKEILVENGGDICLKIDKPLNLSMESGGNRNFKNIGIEILASRTFLGICSSSGMFGHSFSYGKADLLMCIAEDPVLADNWATSLANKVKEEADIDKLMKDMPIKLNAVLAIKNKKIGYNGKYKLIKM